MLLRFAAVTLCLCHHVLPAALPLPATTPLWLPTWQCTGPYSDLQYRDCEGEYYNTSGCYFLEHFAQYRPCSGICNNVAINSIKEDKCRIYCPVYFKSCRITSSTTKSLDDQPTKTHSRNKNFVEFVLPVFALGVLIGIITLSVYIHQKRRVHKHLTPLSFSNAQTVSSPESEELDNQNNRCLEETAQPSDIQDYNLVKSPILTSHPDPD